MDIKNLVKKMTLEEKASLCSGWDFWNTKKIDRLNIPSMMVSDGPHGLRKQDYSEKGDRLGVNDSIKATCFPTGVGIAASFDRKLVEKLGTTLGKEAAAEKLAVLLGPAINIKRSPLCGRNFEYLSEDPYLTGELGVVYTKAVQAQGVGVSLKHFAANNQETGRATNSSEVDERTLREIYFLAFEKIVKEADPWTVMCAYNKLNGVFCSENNWLLNKVLREEWGFKGFVVSDWGAVQNKVDSMRGGLDLEMPANGGPNDFRLQRAVLFKNLSEDKLDLACERILTVLYNSIEKRVEAEYDREKDHQLSREIASQTMVLLKNEKILPLQMDKKYAVIGKFAKTPRFQGGGSSHINSYKVTSFWDAAEKLNKEYAEGWGNESKIDNKYIDKACEVAKNSDVALLFVGLTDIYESEGYDRSNIQLPPAHNALVEAVSKVNPNTVVILHNGSPVAMPWIDKVKGVLEAYLGGEASGGAVYDILFGKVNPSAKLAETFPIRDEDVPCYPYFPGFRRTVEYREGLYVGYRYYDKVNKKVLFPFGYGLSYTSFKYSDIKVNADKLDVRKGSLKVSFKIQNVGKVDGAEAAQVYVKDVESTVYKPEKELKGFEKVFLKAGEEKEISVELDKRAFAFWNDEVNNWTVESGEFEILVAASSQDIRLTKTVDIVGDEHKILNLEKQIPSYYTGNIEKISDSEFLALTKKTKLYPREFPKDYVFDEYNNFGDVEHTRFGKLIVKIIKLVAKSQGRKTVGLGNEKIIVDMAKETPLNVMSNFSGGLLSKRMVKGMLLKFNATGKGVKGFFQTLKGTCILLTSLFSIPKNAKLGKVNKYDEPREKKEAKQILKEL